MELIKTQKTSLAKAITFCFLILLGTGLLQFLAQYIFESFNKLLVILVIAGALWSFLCYYKYCQKHLWIPLVMITVFSLLFAALATFMSDVLLVMKAYGSSFDVSFTQLYYALFDVSRVDPMFDPDMLADAIHRDMRLGLIFAGIGIALSYVFAIIMIIRLKKQTSAQEIVLKAPAENTSQPVIDVQQSTQQTTKEQVAQRTSDDETTFKNLFANMRQVVVGYKQDKNKDLFLEGIDAFKKKFNSLDADKKQQFKQYVKQNYAQSSDSDDVVAAHLIESRIN